MKPTLWAVGLGVGFLVTGIFYNKDPFNRGGTRSRKGDRSKVDNEG